jgi:hypothetical protein
MAIRSAVFKDRRQVTTDLTTYSFSALDIGTIRPVTVYVGYATGGDSHIVSSATLGGVAMTKVIEQRSGGGSTTAGFLCATITEADVPSANSANLSITLNGSNNQIGIGWWLSYDLTSATPVDSASVNVDAAALDCDLAEGDQLLVVGTGRGSGITAMPTGYAERWDVTVEDDQHYTGGDYCGLTAETPRAISIDWSGTPDRLAAAAIVLRPNPMAPAAASLVLTPFAPINRLAFFSATQSAAARGRHVCCPRFVHFAFDSEDVRVWEGYGDIVVDGETWKGLGELGSIADSNFGVSDAATNVTYTLSGVSSRIVAAAKAQADEVRGRLVRLYGQFLDVETLEPLDSLFAIRIDVMDVLSYSGGGPSDRSVTLTAETIWTARNAASFAYFSNRDQDTRFAGDLGLDFLPLYRPGVRRLWPIY